MIIHQITDLHIPDEAFGEANAHIKPNVLRQLEFVKSKQPDLLVISGDLSMSDRSEEACLWLKQHLPDVDTVVIPGNHDNPSMIREIFGSWPFVSRHKDCDLVFLDTANFTLSAQQIDDLSNLTTDQRCLAFMHHPPSPISGGFMDLNHALKNQADTCSALQSSPISAVFCGHFHNQAQLQCDGFDLYLTPSPAYQVSLTSEEFLTEEFDPSVRLINVDSSRVNSELIAV